MIKLLAIGHLGKDATANKVGDQHVINFSVCHTEKYRDSQGNQKEKSIWVECAQWSSKESGVTQCLKKGTQVYVEGSPEIKTFSKNDGTTGHSLTLRVVNLQLLGSAKGDGATPAQTSAAAKPGGYKAVPNGEGEPIDDLPF